MGESPQIISPCGCINHCVLRSDWQAVIFFNESSIFKIVFCYDWEPVWLLSVSVIVLNFPCLRSHIALVPFSFEVIFYWWVLGSMAIPFVFLFAITTCYYWIFLVAPLYILGFGFISCHLFCRSHAWVYSFLIALFSYGDEIWWDWKNMYTAMFLFLKVPVFV